MDNDYIEIDCRHWDTPDRWEPEWIPADDPKPGLGIVREALALLQEIADRQIRPEPQPSDTEWNALKPITHQPHAPAVYMAWGTDGQPRFCNRPEPKPEGKEPTMLIKIRQEGKDRKAPLAYRRDEKEYRLVMQAYHERLEGKLDAQERWNAISAGATRGLSVEESLRVFGRPGELS